MDTIMGDSNHHLLRVGRDEQDDVSFHPSENNFAYLLFIMSKLPGVTQLFQSTTAGAELIYPVSQMNRTLTILCVWFASVKH